MHPHTFVDGRMNPAAVQRDFGIAIKTLAIWRTDGTGPRFVKVGGRVFYFREDVERFCQGRRVRSTAQARLVKHDASRLAHAVG